VEEMREEGYTVPAVELLMNYRGQGEDNYGAITSFGRHMALLHSASGRARSLCQRF
jgi:hypothetical protein